MLKFEVPLLPSLNLLFVNKYWEKVNKILTFQRAEAYFYLKQHRGASKFNRIELKTIT